MRLSGSRRKIVLTIDFKPGLLARRPPVRRRRLEDAT
jgi:hypothetical protein